MMLAPYASDPARSRGREFPMENGLARGERSPYQRDRDRIIHSIAFRRLRYKTQVFVAPDGDHYRVRLTHSLEVAQIARVIARILGLDEDLTEGLALAHDIGHPPFGHAGEEALDAALHKAGGFDHNANTLRTLMRIDSPYPHHDGLNLTWETLEGLAKHNGPVANPSWALRELNAAYDLELGTHASLEAQVAALSDDIAYDNHDIDDGLRAGFLDLDELLAHPFIAANWGEVERRYPDISRERQLAELLRSQIGTMVNDLIAESQKRLVGVESVEEVRAAGRPLIAFSAEMEEGERAFKRFMYEKLYYHPEQLETAKRARAVLAELYAAYSQEPVLMDESWIDTLPRTEPERSRHIADYIAGMTDRFAITCHENIYGRTPAGLRNV
ncbi:deoxyguanosinetriphosphate triphosphohydrolase [Novosphingobium mangrovi (ex Hu et al. 2023)]|uniref:Deoxyguanosinetriphosphate triphosphohydrolase-like protein n=1 Tax=Novosphingobium mangrovi (ex Hu et al. 2023) TaxID=2930094 RepID=A0ABT0AA61_9SPHN|nr:deoxyguanosinetriphosphate triphosphohydrolase [Novosphingobium mangrovi (ex Hu et al. 2023)]MCJ1960077.1 deoxyguanosinetriphosphate triphosphohydrolase [Novosphingobium mangrovi (ex Hu et al. 2023)]